MKKSLIILGLVSIFFSSTLLSQNFWIPKDPNAILDRKGDESLFPEKYRVFELNLDALKSTIAAAPMRGASTNASPVIVSFPTASGRLNSYRILEAPVLDAELSTQYPNIKSYAGQGVENPSEIIRFSISHLGLKSMLLSSLTGNEFIEPFSEDLTHYMVYRRADRSQVDTDFECELKHTALEITNQSEVKNNADDGILRNYRLAVSTNGEYTNYFGGTVADALAAINTSMTRVNGLFENDFNVTMTLIAATTNVIYTNSNTDPYGNNSGSWNGQLQSTLTSNIGEANYDVGHLFALGGNNGNAGCIGCVCVNNQKGSGFTSRSVPEGDPFDVDYVAHELGHQFGGNHTWTFNGNEGTNVQMEPGSGSTIMGYAGITGATDVQANSDPYFHAATIQQITDYVKTTSCQIDMNTGNAPPSANAGSNYIIPRGTPFTLTGSGTDPEGNQVTYCWEQIDENNASSTYPSTTATSGVAFRSLSPTVSPERTFPELATILTGSTATTWEAVPDVARTLNFRLTVRDNQAGGACNESDDMQVTVSGTTGPFLVSQPNTVLAWPVGSTQTVTWDVAGTTGSPINTSTVNIRLSTDGGYTFPITLAASTANDGSEVVTVPNFPSNFARVKIEATNNIFFDISDTNFTIGDTAPVSYCTSNGNNQNDEYIGNVTLNTINNSTGASTGGYGDYTNISTDLTQGTSFNISVTPTWTGTLYNEGYAVWIDYNKNGDFTDAGDLVFSSAPSQTTPVTGSFTIPVSAPAGATRMRVSMKYNGVPDPCESFSYGEVEDYTVNISAPILPVDWLYFHANLTEKETVQLEWATAMEQNAEEFIIERSADGRNFMEIARQSAAGNSTTQRTYSNEDTQPLSGVSYYRIRQVDFNGATTFSNVETITLRDASTQISVYPNPISGGDNLQIVSGLEEDLDIILFNSKGQKILRSSVVNGNGMIPLNLPTGIYFYEVISGDNLRFSNKLLVK